MMLFWAMPKNNTLKFIVGYAILEYICEETDHKDKMLINISLKSVR